MLEPWHLDRRVPIALILAIAAQTFAAVWWARGTVAQIEDNSRRVVALEASRDMTTRLLSDMSRDMAVVRRDSDAMQRQLVRIERLLDRRAEGRSDDRSAP